MKKWINWLKTGEGGDERIEGINARTGYLSFILLIFLIAIRIILLFVGLMELSSPYVDLGILLFISFFHLGIRGLLGVGTTDLEREMKNPLLFYVISALIGGIVSAVIAFFSVQRFESNPNYLMAITLSFFLGSVISFLIGFLIRFIADNIANAKMKAELGENDEIQGQSKKDQHS
jgi:ABC-type Fe3+-siderophore transport system permease subunit